jgi:hypothetical protein
MKRDMLMQQLHVALSLALLLLSRTAHGTAPHLRHLGQLTHPGIHELHHLFACDSIVTIVIFVFEINLFLWRLRLRQIVLVVVAVIVWVIGTLVGFVQQDRDNKAVIFVILLLVLRLEGIKSTNPR